VDYPRFTASRLSLFVPALVFALALGLVLRLVLAFALAVVAAFAVVATLALIAAFAVVTALAIVATFAVVAALGFVPVGAAIVTAAHAGGRHWWACQKRPGGKGSQHQRTYSHKSNRKMFHVQTPVFLEEINSHTCACPKPALAVPSMQDGQAPSIHE